jgi:hypothetical protein
MLAGLETMTPVQVSEIPLQDVKDIEISQLESLSTSQLQAFTPAQLWNMDKNLFHGENFLLSDELRPNWTQAQYSWISERMKRTADFNKTPVKKGLNPVRSEMIWHKSVPGFFNNERDTQIPGVFSQNNV